MPREPKVNVETGEITVVPLSIKKRMTPPKSANVTTLKTLAGENPMAVNLKDNPQLNGKDVVISSVIWKEGNAQGKITTYILADAFITEPGQDPTEADYVLLMTGSENIVARLADAELAAGEGSPYPLRGTLRCAKGGRAWFID